jgi:hypothetical protein
MRHALGGHEPPICGEANARFNPVIAAARPPTRANRASERGRRQRIPCLDRPARGTPAGAITGNASGRHRGGNGIAGSALGRHPIPRIRPSSRPTAPDGTPSDAVAGNALGCHPTRQVVTSLRGGAAQPAHAARRRSGERDRADCARYHAVTVIPIESTARLMRHALGRCPIIPVPQAQLSTAFYNPILSLSTCCMTFSTGVAYDKHSYPNPFH